MSDAQRKTMKGFVTAYVTFLIVLVAIDVYYKRRMEARFQEGLEAFYEKLAATPAAYPPSAPPVQAAYQPAAVSVPAPEPQTFPVVENITPTPAQPMSVQNGAAPAAVPTEPAVMAGGRPVTEGQLEGPLI